MQQDSLGAGPLDQVWQVTFVTGDVPLFEAVHWVATKGGSDSFRPDLWPDAWAKIASAWRKDELTVSGRPAARPAVNHSFAEIIPGKDIAGDLRCIPPYPYGLPHDFEARRAIGDPTSETGPCVLFWGRTDHVSWRHSFNDTLFVPGKCGWTHLTVLKADILRIWPFGSAALPEAASTEPPQLSPAVETNSARTTTRHKRPIIQNALTKLNEDSQIDLTCDPAGTILRKAKKDVFGPEISKQILEWYGADNKRANLTKMIKRIQNEQSQGTCRAQAGDGYLCGDSADSVWTSQK